MILKDLGNGVRVPMTTEEEAEHIASNQKPVERSRAEKIALVDQEALRRYDALKACYLLNKKIDGTITAQEITELNNILNSLYDFTVVIKGEIEASIDPDKLNVTKDPRWP